MITWTGEVIEAWVDYNGHLRDAYYGLIFSYAVDGLMAHIGLDAQSREHSAHSLFTLEAHLHYLHEVKLGTLLQVCVQPVAMDRKRLQLYLTLQAGGTEQTQGDTQVLAASEQMLLHVDLAGPRAAPFSEVTQTRLAAMIASQRAWPAPAYPARVLSLA